MLELKWRRENAFIQTDKSVQINGQDDMSKQRGYK